MEDMFAINISLTQLTNSNVKKDFNLYILDIIPLSIGRLYKRQGSVINL